MEKDMQIRVEETAQWSRYLVSKPVDQSQASYNLGKTLAVILTACNPRTWEVDRGDSLDQSGSQNQQALCSVRDNASIK